jgi:hypothetical protein
VDARIVNGVFTCGVGKVFFGEEPFIGVDAGIGNFVSTSGVFSGEEPFTGMDG